MKRLVFIFAFLILCAAVQANARGIMTMCGAGVPVVAAGITLDASLCQRVANEDNQVSHSQGSLTNGIAIVMLGWAPNAATGVSVSYGGSAMTKISDVNRSGLYFSQIYKLDLGTSSSGSKTVLADYNGTMYSSMMCVRTYSGVEQSAEFTTGTVEAWGNAPSISIATGASGVVLAGLSAGDTTITEGQTLIAEYKGSQSYGFQGAAGTGGNVAMGWSLGASVHYAASAVVLK